MQPTHRTTWVDERGTWRVYRDRDGYWRLSRWSPRDDAWQVLGMFPNRAAAVEAAADSR